MNTKSKGEISEGVILAELLKQGKIVLLPFGNNQRFDMVVYDEGTFVRVQVKTGCLRDGCVSFHACSTNGFTSEHKGYQGEADVFAVYCPDNAKSYWVPVNKVGDTVVTLRINPAKNGSNMKSIRWAKDFEICRVAQSGSAHGS